MSLPATRAEVLNLMLLGQVSSVYKNASCVSQKVDRLVERRLGLRNSGGSFQFHAGFRVELIERVGSRRQGLSSLPRTTWV